MLYTRIHTHINRHFYTSVPRFQLPSGIGATRLSQLELNQLPGENRWDHAVPKPDCGSIFDASGSWSPTEASGLASQGFAARGGVAAPLQDDASINPNRTISVKETR